MLLFTHKFFCEIVSLGRGESAYTTHSQKLDFKFKIYLRSERSLTETGRKMAGILNCRAHVVIISVLYSTLSAPGSGHECECGQGAGTGDTLTVAALRLQLFRGKNNQLIAE